MVGNAVTASCFLASTDHGGRHGTAPAVGVQMRTPPVTYVAGEDAGFWSTLMTLLAKVHLYQQRRRYIIAIDVVAACVPQRLFDR